MKIKANQCEAFVHRCRFLPFYFDAMKIENLLWQFSQPFADNEICQFQLCQATDHAPSPAHRQLKRHSEYNFILGRYQKSISTVRQMCQFYIQICIDYATFLKLCSLYGLCRHSVSSYKVITVVSGVRRLSTAVWPEARNMGIFELILNRVKRRRRRANNGAEGVARV